MLEDPSCGAIRVYVVDDHPMIRDGIAAMLRSANDLVLAGETDSGAKAVELAAAVRADVVLMDLKMPDLDGIEATAMLSRRSPAIKVIVMTGAAVLSEVHRAVAAGAAGYLLKTASAVELVTAVRAVHAGYTTFSTSVVATSTNSRREVFPDVNFTAREFQVLAAMVRGLTNKEIAEELEVSLPTVKFHISNILSKLHVGSRTQAVLIALQHSLLDRR